MVCFRGNHAQEHRHLVILRKRGSNGLAALGDTLGLEPKCSKKGLLGKLGLCGA